MPELPEVQTLADTFTAQFGHTGVLRAELGSLSALKTYDPPFEALAGATLLAARRRGKFLILDMVDSGGEPMQLVIHLSRAGWVHWRRGGRSAPLRPGRTPVALRLVWDTDPPTTVDVTEAGTRKRLAVYVVRVEGEVPGLQRLGPDALQIDLAAFADLLAAAGRRHLKTVLREQQIIAGIGNAYSDEILHAARLSPYAGAATLSREEVSQLHLAMRSVLTEATDRCRRAGVGDAKQEKREGLQVHGRTGQPCPVCATAIREVRLADSTFQYCPTCQTGGKPLADRRLSRLVK